MSNIIREIERVKKTRSVRELNESTAQTAIVLPVLRALDWDTRDPYQVVREHPVRWHQPGFADIVLKSREKPLVLVETKAPGSGPLKRKKNLDQLFGYCKMLQVEVGVLTNGITWLFYLVNPQSANPGLSDQMDLISEESDICASKLQRILGRDTVCNGGAHEFVREAYIKQTIEQEWNKLLLSGDQKIVLRLRAVVREALDIKVSKADLAGIEEFVKQQAIRPAGSADPQMDASASSPSEPVGQPKVTHGKAHGDESPEIESSREAKRLRPTHVEAYGERYEVGTWKDVMVKYAGAAYHRDPTLFHVTLEQTLAMRSPLFVQSSMEPEHMREPRRISDSNFWVETHRSSANIIVWCRKFQKLLSLGPESLRIYRGDALVE